MNTTFQDLLSNIQNKPLRVVNDNLKIVIYDTLKTFFPMLRKEDIDMLSILETFLIDVISFKCNINNTEQWRQNNGRDIKSSILLLLPFIDDKNDSYLLKELTDLNHLVCSSKMDKSVLLEKRELVMRTHFKYSNIGLGLLDNYDISSVGLIYDIIHHNFISLLQTLEIINGKYYINWINIVPLNFDNFYDSIIYKATEAQYLNLLTNKNSLDNILSENMLYYQGLWFGDIYNVIRNKLYNDIKYVKWVIFPYTLDDNVTKYLIQILNDIFNIDLVIQTDKYYYELNEEKNNFIKKKIIFQILK